MASPHISWYPSPLEFIVNDKPVLAALHDAVVAGEEDALNRHRPGDLRTKRGTYAYYERDSYLSNSIVLLGWEAKEVSNQRRFISPLGRYPFQFQLLHTRGWLDANMLSVNKKGPLTRFLIRNNPIVNPNQTTFDFPEIGVSESVNSLPTIFIVASVYRDYLSTHLVLPVDIDDSGTTIECAESYAEFPIHVLNMGASREVPQGVDLPFPDITRRDEID